MCVDVAIRGVGPLRDTHARRLALLGQAALERVQACAQLRACLCGLHAGFVGNIPQQCLYVRQQRVGITG
ncbi:hypothetical protein D9M68_397880 [compost metagenome]